MAANIQPPDPKRFKWEHHTVVVRPPSGSRSPQEGTEMVPPLKPHRTPPDTANLYRNPPRGSSRARILSPSGGDFDAGDNVSKVAEGSTTVVHSQRGFWCVIATAAAEDPKPLASDSASRVLDQVNKCATGYEHHQPARVQSNVFNVLLLSSLHARHCFKRAFGSSQAACLRSYLACLLVV